MKYERVKQTVLCHIEDATIPIPTKSKNLSDYYNLNSQQTPTEENRSPDWKTNPPRTTTRSNLEKQNEMRMSV